MDKDEIIIVIDNNRNSIKYYQKNSICWIIKVKNPQTTCQILKIVHRSPEKSEYGLMLNKLCNIEDWDNAEIKKLIKKLQTTTVESYLCQKDWSIIKGNILLPRKLGVIHRKDWEWSMGILSYAKTK